jgi:outer membrane immunogenic protein
MNKLLLGIGLAGLIGTSTMAADLRPPAAPVEFFTWTGGYVGVNLGAGWRQPVDFVTTAPPCAAATCLFSSPIFAADLVTISAIGTGSAPRASGATGGFQVGYNYQAGPVVLGVEADWEYFKRNSSFVGTGTLPVSGLPFAVNYDLRSSWLATVRGRLGFGWDRLLIYATGGVAFTNVNYDQAITTPTTSDFGTISSVQAISDTKTGWVVGGGAEYALWNHLTVRAEYLYAQFTGVSLLGTLARSGIPSLNNPVIGSTGKLNDHIVRLGLNYKFGYGGSY